MKYRVIISLLLTVFSVSAIAQTYTTIPYSTSFEGANYIAGDASWESVVEGSNPNVARVRSWNGYTPYDGSWDLNFDNIGSNSNRTSEAWFYVDLTGETEVTMGFYYKDYGDEKHTGATGDGVYFSDDSGATFVEYHIDPDLYPDLEWNLITIDVDKFAADNGINITDSLLIIKFQTRAAKDVDEGDTTDSDGMAIDSFYIEPGGPLTAGAITGSDTICGGTASNVAISNAVLPTEGDDDYTYTWQIAYDGFSWSNYAAPDLEDLVVTGPETNTFWIRRGVSSPSSGEGPLYTTPVIVVLPTPQVASIAGLANKYCSNEDSVVLSVSPPGGTFTDITPGSSLTGFTFAPGDAVDDSLGAVNELKYVYTDNYGCEYSDSVTTTVYTAPVVTFDPVGSYPEDDNTPVPLDPLISADRPGTYTVTGSGVALDGSNNWIFTPSASGGPGVKTLTCTYTSASNLGSCEVEVTQEAYVTTNSTGTIFNPDEYCETDAPQFTTFTRPGAPPFYGWFYCNNGSAVSSFVSESITGTGITWNSGNQAIFDPGVAGPGVHTITYTYRYRWDYDWCFFTSGGTTYYYDTRTVSQSITVYAEPVVDITLPKTSYCAYEAADNYQTRRYNSSNNTWPLITPDQIYLDGAPTGATFNPGTAGVGMHEVIVEYSQNLCTAFDTFYVNVDSIPIVNLTGIDPTYCNRDNYDVFVATPAGGTFTGINSSAIAQDSSRFYPENVSSAGSYTITYSYTDSNLCTASASQNTQIFNAPNLNITGLSSSLKYCTDDSPVALQGQNNGVNFSGGVFSGPGVTDGGNNGTGTFDPSILPTDSTYTVTYNYIDGNGCTDTSIRNVQVNPLPDVDFYNLNAQYCEDYAVESLDGSPSGGVFSGTGIIGSNFDPGVAVGTHNITYTYTDADGCTNDTTKQTTVDSIPLVQFSGLETEYCEDAPIDTLFGTQPNGVFSGMFTFDTIGDAVGLNVNSVFDPGNYTIYYRFTDGNGCSSADTQSFKVNPLPIPSITGLLSSYCEDDSVSNLIGNVNADHPYGYNTSSFFGQYPPDVTFTGLSQADFNPSQVPIATAGGQTTDTISFVYVDSKGCRDTATQVTTVHGLPVIDVWLTDSTLCEDAGSVALNIDKPGGAGTENYYLESSGATILGGLFDPSSNNNELGVNSIVFEYTDEFGCVNYDTTSATVYPLPDPNFYLGSFCNNDSISFFDSSFVGDFTVGTNDDVITNWFWTFGDGGDDSIQNPKHQYLIPTNYTIELTVTTREGCVQSYDESQLIGEPPTADFSWDNVCEGEILSFTDESTDQQVDPIDTWIWNFDDGNGLDNTIGGNQGTDNVQPVDNNGGITAGTYANPTHEYQSINTYQVSLFLRTGSGCVDTVVKTLNIRPVIDTYPYSEDFEVSNGGWFPGGSIDGVPNTFSWQRAIASGNTISETNANISWITNPTGDHADEEQSYVDGPCFDFTNLVRPMIIMDVWADMLEGSDGAVLQWSDDNGVNWYTIGEIGDGINWYNKTSISGNPGNQAINQVGWSYQDTGWVEARHDLDVLAGMPQVRLRVAFGSDGTSANEGIAFDNVRIQERSRITLLEYFTNSSEDGSLQDDAYIDNLKLANQKDLVDIQYHTEFPGNDEMNNHNPADPSARALYYGAFNVGRGVLNGNQYNGVSSEITSNHIKLQMLKDSPYSITIGKELAGGEITSTAYLRAQRNINDADVTLHLAVIERQITAINGVNGDTEFRSVLKKMLPSASGTLIKRDFVAGDEIGVEESWTLANVFDENELEVIAFVQDNVTNEVYQVSTTDVNSVPDVFVPPLGDQGLIDIAQELKFKLIPNPSNGNVMLLFNQVVSQPSVQFVDMSGRVIDNFSFSENMEYVNFELQYPAGMYYVQVKSEDRVITKKLVITK